MLIDRGHRRPLLAMVLALHLALPGCADEEASQIVVAIASDLEVPAQLDLVRVSVTRQQQQLVSQPYNLDPSKPKAAKLPETFTLRARRDLSTPVMITVIGEKGGAEVVKRQARLAFIEGKALLLKMHLLRSCASLAKPCPATQTCTEQGCQSMDVDPTTLPEYSSGEAFKKPKQDGGPADKGPDMALDLGPDQAQQDAGSDTSPDTVKPDLQRPDLATPDLNQPDLAKPDRAIPDLAQPDAVKQKCGNSIVEGTEACDKTSPGTKTCKDYGYDNGTLSCQSNCTHDTSQCYKCGDGKVTGKEPCEKPNDLAGKTCVSQGHTGGKLACTSSCTLDQLECYTFPDKADLAVSAEADDQAYADVAFGGGMFLVVWEDHRGSSNEIYGARVDLGGKVLDPNGLLIAASSNYYQRAPSVASDGAGFLVAWLDTGGKKVLAARVSTAGKVLDKPAIKVSSFTPAASTPHPRTKLAFGAGNYMVVWHHSATATFPTEIRGALLSPKGVLQGSSPFLIASHTTLRFKPDVASDGAGFLVVWQDGLSTKATVYATPVDKTGKPKHTNGKPLMVSTRHQYDPSVVGGGQGYLVLWRDAAVATTIGADVHAARVSSGGLVVAPGEFAIAATTTATQDMPAAAFDGANFLAVWNQDTGASKEDLFGARVTPAGKVINSGLTLASTSAARNRRPALAFGAGNYLVVWERATNQAKPSWDIHARRFTPGK